MDNHLNSKQIQILEVAEKLFAEKGFDRSEERRVGKECPV